MTMAKVSILIPLYNSEDYIAETLDSVLHQTYTNWECIVIDDNSIDHSYKIVKKYQDKYPDKIKLFSNPKKGACSARNYAFEKSTGDYIQYLDADDLLSENKLEEQINVFKLHGNDIIVNCRWGRFSNENVYTTSVKHQLIDKDYDNPIDWLTDSWLGYGMSAIHCWLTPRLIVSSAGPWNESLLKNQDGEFFCRILLNVSKIKFSENSIAYYRDTLNSVSKNTSYDACYSTFFSYKLYVSNTCFLQNNKLDVAICVLFSIFYKNVFPNFPDLLKEAEHEVHKLGFKDFIPSPLWSSCYGVSRIIGFKRTVSIVNKLKYLK